jgi:beta-fructofuranosidase
VQNRAGQWQLLAFRNGDGDGGFIGDIIDPRPVSWVDGRLQITPAE